MALAPIVAALVALSPGAAPGADLPATPVKALVHHAVSTTNAAAQEAFDEGLTLVYAFNREEARKRFERAAKLDPRLAMAQWGIALAVGPNVNIPMTAEDLAVAVPALVRAKALEASASPAERGYIEALAQRYPAKIADDSEPGFGKYRDAMAALHLADPNDPDAAALYGESIMDVDDWGWNGSTPIGSERKLLDALRAALAVDPQHVGANHYLIHALDATPAIAAGALPSARLLAALPAEPAASHLVHMSGHTFLDVGNFVELENGKIEFKSGVRPTFSEAFADALVTLGDRDRRIIAITAAMPDGTQLKRFAKKHPDRYFDVGIAEAHGVCFAAGAAASGLKPVVAIYSTFMQRAYDQVVHDIVLQNLPVVLAMDRAGFAADDGPTHMGLYDIAFMRTLPFMTIMAPRTEAEMMPMLEHALSLGTPVSIRYPRGNSNGNHLEAPAPIVQGRAEILRKGSGVALLALGNTCDHALDAYDLVEPSQRPTVVNMRFVRPLDEALLVELAQTHGTFITLEEHALAGGFGSAVTEFVCDRALKVGVERIGVPNTLIQHGKQPNQRASVGLSGESIAARVRTLSSIVAPAAVASATGD